MHTYRQALCDMGLEDAIVFDSPDYNDAIIGVTHDDRVVYSHSLMVRCLVAEDGMTEEEAVEFIDYNTLGSLPYIGDKGPVVVFDLIY